MLPSNLQIPPINYGIVANFFELLINQTFCTTIYLLTGSKNIDDFQIDLIS